MRWGFFSRQWKCSETGDGCTMQCTYEKAMNCALQNGCTVWAVNALNKAAIKKGDELAQLLGPLIYNELQPKINSNKKGRKKRKIKPNKTQERPGPCLAWPRCRRPAARAWTGPAQSWGSWEAHKQGSSHHVLCDAADFLNA